MHQVEAHDQHTVDDRSGEDRKARKREDEPEGLHGIAVDVDSQRRGDRDHRHEPGRRHDDQQEAENTLSVTEKFAQAGLELAQRMAVRIGDVSLGKVDPDRDQYQHATDRYRAERRTPAPLADKQCAEGRCDHRRDRKDHRHQRHQARRSLAARYVADDCP